MSRYTPDLGALMQNGLLGGMSASRQQQSLDMQREAMARDAEMEAIRQQLLAQELVDRKRMAAEYLRGQEADARFMQALLGASEDAAPAPTGPRPQQARAGMGPQADDGSAQLAVASRQGRTGMGPMPDDGTAGVAAGATGASPPRGRASEWWAGINPADLPYLSRDKQELLVRAKGGRLALQQARRDAETQYRSLEASGMVKYVDPKVWDEWMMLGVPVDISKAPPVIGRRAENNAEITKNAYIDLMTIHEPPPGQMVPPLVDEAKRADLMTRPPEYVEVVYQQHLAEQAMERKRQEHAAKIDEVAAGIMAARGVSPAVARGMATMVVNGAGSLAQGRADPLADDQMRYAVQAAKEKMERAEKEYRGATATKAKYTGVVHEGVLAPPTDAERERLKHPAETEPFDGIADMDEDEYAALRAKVAAWDAYQKAKGEYERTIDGVMRGGSRAAAPAAPAAQADSGTEKPAAGSGGDIDKMADALIDAVLGGR